MAVAELSVKPRYRVAAHADGRIERITEIMAPRPEGASIVPSRKGAMNLAGSSIGGGFEGSQRTRRLFGFRPSEGGINSLLVFAGATLRARARYLVRNNAYAKKAQRVFVSNLVGTGIRPIPQVEDPALKTAITELFEDWSEECDADGIADFYGQQTLIARALFDAGECFIRRRPRYASDGLAVPMQLQVLESEFCPLELNYVAENGNLVRAGIEFDAIGRRVAYWFWRTHPGEFAMPTTQIGYTRVPAEDVLHLFEPLRPGQIRGVSWLAAAIVRAYLLDSYDDAELERKKTAALFAGFIERPDNNPDDPPLGQQDQPAAGVADQSLNAPGETIAGLTPGMLQVLMPGEKITFSNPADVGPGFEAFEYRALLAMCAGMDMPYSYVTGDFAKANYSSQRAALLDLRASIRQVQELVMMFQLCRPAYGWFMSDATIAGALPLTPGEFNKTPRKYTRAQWVPPRMEWVDPLKDMEADRLAMRSGVKSREEIALSRGTTIASLDAAIARGNESADAHGLVLDSDPRRTNARGSAPAPVTTPPPPESTAQDNADEQAAVDDTGNAADPNA